MKPTRTSSGRGGRREGAGRKPLSPDEPTIHVTIRLTEREAQTAKTAGNGNISAGIRKALELFSPSQ